MTDHAQNLLDYATHSERADWQWTRNHDIKHIRYARDFQGYRHPLRRAQRLIARRLPGKTRRSSKRIDALLGFRYDENYSLWEKIQGVWYGLQSEVIVTLLTDKNLPDGILKNAGVIAHWEEDGEYLQMVQPSVGKLLAEFLLEEPEHPHAKKILAELARISEDYGRRVAAGEVSGKKTDAN